MKKQIIIYAIILWVLAGCGISNPLNKTPQQDIPVYSLIEKLNNKPGDANYKKQLLTEYESSIARHKQNIEEYRQSNQLEKWEKIMNEYGQLEKLAEAVTHSPSAQKAVTVQKIFRGLCAGSSKSSRDILRPGYSLS